MELGSQQPKMCLMLLASAARDGRSRNTELLLLSSCLERLAQGKWEQS